MPRLITLLALAPAANALLKPTRRAPVPNAEKGSFQVSPPARAATPETAVLAVGEDEDAPLEPAPPPADAQPSEAQDGAPGP